MFEHVDRAARLALQLEFVHVHSFGFPTRFNIQNLPLRAGKRK
jgi:hypothetical protein